MYFSAYIIVLIIHSCGDLSCGFLTTILLVRYVISLLYSVGPADGIAFAYGIDAARRGNQHRKAFLVSMYSRSSVKCIEWMEQHTYTGVLMSYPYSLSLIGIIMNFI